MSTYMDDSMDSVQDYKTGIAVYHQLSELWKRAGMNARKWLSNSQNVLECIPPEDRAQEADLNSQGLPTTKILGVWRHA